MIKAFRPKYTHIQLVKNLSANGSTKYSLSLLNKRRFDEETYNYMKEYSYYNFNSGYKNWFELNQKEKNKFMENYTRMYDQKTQGLYSLKNCIRTMDKQNKDVMFMFSLLYESLRESADSNSNLTPTNNNVVVAKDDSADSLLFKRC